MKSLLFFIFPIIIGLLSVSECAVQIDCSAASSDRLLSFGTLWNNGGPYIFQNLLDNQDQRRYTYEIQICGAVQTTFPVICTDPNSAANRIDVAAGTCVSIGSINATGWNENAGNLTSGLNLVYYHGNTNTTDDIEYTSRIFFECTSHNQNVFNFQSENLEYDQFIFTMVTPLACSDKGSPINTTVATPSGSTSPIPNCGMDVNSSYVDLSSLFATNGGYLFVNSTGNANQAAYTYEIQVCGDVKTNFPNNCLTPSAANRIDPITHECVSIGDLNTITWEVDTNNKGVYAVLYHGASFGNSDYEYSARIFFECASAQGIPSNTMFFENERVDTAQYNFLISTPHACITSSTSVEPPRGTTSTSEAGLINPSFIYLLLAIFAFVFC